MEKQKIDLYLATNAKYFEPSALPILCEKLENLDNAAFLVLYSFKLKNPTIVLLISIFLGSFGIDRFMIGDIGWGALKLSITILSHSPSSVIELIFSSCQLVLIIIDWFIISKKTKQINFENVSMIL